MTVPSTQGGYGSDPDLILSTYPLGSAGSKGGRH